MFMDIPAPGLNIGLQIGDTINDGHGEIQVRGLNILLVLARGHRRPNTLRRLTEV
jgi:hypothetical protein